MGRTEKKTRGKKRGCRSVPPPDWMRWLQPPLRCWLGALAWHNVSKAIGHSPQMSEFLNMSDCYIKPCPSPPPPPPPQVITLSIIQMHFFFRMYFIVYSSYQNCYPSDIFAGHTFFTAPDCKRTSHRYSNTNSGYSYMRGYRKKYIVLDTNVYVLRNMSSEDNLDCSILL